MTLAHDLWRLYQKHRAQQRPVSGYEGASSSRRMQDEHFHFVADRPSHRYISELLFDVLRKRMAASGVDEEATQSQCLDVPDGDSEYCLSIARDTFRNKRFSIGGAAETEAANASFEAGSYAPETEPGPEAAAAPKAAARKSRR